MSATTNPKENHVDHNFNFAGPRAAARSALEPRHGVHGAERAALGLEGLLPAAVLSLDDQAMRSYEQYLRAANRPGEKRSGGAA